MSNFDNDTLLEDAIYQAILRYYFDEECQSSKVHLVSTMEACCQVMASFAALNTSHNTEFFASKLASSFSSHRERFVEFYDENPLNRPGKFGHPTQ